MRTTVSVIKADIGGIAGHTRPSPEVLGRAAEIVKGAIGSTIINARVTFTGDDICFIMTHAHGTDHKDVHGLAWSAFMEGTKVAQSQGLYGAGQDILKEAFSGNVRGLGPGSAELEFTERPNEAIIVYAADKTEPGAFNMPLYLVFGDPMYSAGLLVSNTLHQGFTFRIMDVEYKEGDRVVDLQAPEQLYDLAVLLRDVHRFVIESIWSRAHPNEQAAAVSTSRLRNIAGKYVGKDDPVAVVRTQKIFPATEEFGPPFARLPFVGGNTRGSHYLPLVPVPQETEASSDFCIPMVSALGLSVHEGRITATTDLFAGFPWDAVRANSLAKMQAMRDQGFFSPAMLPTAELEYNEIRDILQRLEARFKVN